MKDEEERMKDEGRRMKAGKATGVVDLRVRTTNFALRVIQMFASFPKTTEAQVLGKQVLRSGTSVGANYREAYRARSKQEFIAKVGDCLKEADESAYWLELLVEAGVVPAQQMVLLRDECDQLIAIFTAIAKKTKATLGQERTGKDEI